MAKRVILFILTILLGAGAITGGVFLAWQPNSVTAGLLNSPGILVVLSERAASVQTVADVAESHLVQQAKLFGLYLNPPPPKAPAIKTPYLTAVKPKPESNKPLAPEPPVSMTPKFRVMAVSIYKGKPEKTMALIGEPGAEPRWIKCGEMVGHLLVEDIQNGQVIWRNGEQTGQVAVLMEPGKKPQEHVTTKRATAEPAIMPDPLVEMEEVKDLPPRSKPTPIKRGLQPRR